MQKISYRKCRMKDLAPARRLIKNTINALRRDTGKDPINWPISQQPPPLMAQLLRDNPDGFYCAWKGDKLVGFAGSYLNGKQWYLCWLFVNHRLQDKGVGRKLLEKVWVDGKNITHSLATFAFNPRAVGLYSKFRMVPLCDLPMLKLVKAKFRKLSPTRLKISSEYNSADLKWVHETERKIRGYAHPQHWDIWLKKYPFKLYIARNRGRRVGYFLINDNGWIAPLGVISKKYMIDVMTEAVRAATQIKDVKEVCLWCPTFNIELYLYLILLGFRMDEMEIFMSDVQYPDWQRYVPASLAIL